MDQVVDSSWVKEVSLAKVKTKENLKFEYNNHRETN
jgi:hypothetical protein